MKKFKVIEEGRLSNYDQAKIVGGGSLDCESSGPVHYAQNCKGDTTKVSCPFSYRSCGSGLKIVCNQTAGYGGTPGGAGLVSDHWDTYIP